jgi:hypothetical protein
VQHSIFSNTFQSVTVSTVFGQRLHLRNDSRAGLRPLSVLIVTIFSSCSLGYFYFPGFNVLAKKHPQPILNRRNPWQHSLGNLSKQSPGPPLLRSFGAHSTSTSAGNLVLNQLPAFLSLPIGTAIFTDATSDDLILEFAAHNVHCPIFFKVFPRFLTFRARSLPALAAMPILGCQASKPATWVLCVEDYFR